MTTGFWQQGDCYYCHSAFSVIRFDRLRRKVCLRCGRDLKGRIIKRGPPPKTRKPRLRPSAVNDLKVLKTSQREYWIKKFGNTKLRIPAEPKRKPVEFTLCTDCAEYEECFELCGKARRYADQDQVSPYHVLAATMPEVDGSLAAFLLDPEGAANSEHDNIYLFSTDHQEGLSKFINGSFGDLEMAAVYEADLLDGYWKIKITHPKTPAWFWRQPAPVWIIYMIFKMRIGVRDISRRLELSPGYISKVVTMHRQVLEFYLDRVFPDGIHKTYFYEKYFNQQTNSQIAKKYKVSHQAVSKSIRRTSKKIIESLRNPVAFSQSIREGLLFFRDVQKIMVDPTI